MGFQEFPSPKSPKTLPPFVWQCIGVHMCSVERSARASFGGRDIPWTSRGHSGGQALETLENKHAGADIHDPNTRTSMTPGVQKHFGRKHPADYLSPKRGVCKPAKFARAPPSYGSRRYGFGVLKLEFAHGWSGFLRAVENLSKGRHGSGGFSVDI